MDEDDLLQSMSSHTHTTNSSDSDGSSSTYSRTSDPKKRKKELRKSAPKAATPAADPPAQDAERGAGKGKSKADRLTKGNRVSITASLLRLIAVANNPVMACIPSKARGGHLYYGYYRGHPDGDARQFLLELDICKDKNAGLVAASRQRFKVVPAGAEEPLVSARQVATDSIVSFFFSRVIHLLRKTPVLCLFVGQTTSNSEYGFL